MGVPGSTPPGALPEAIEAVAEPVLRAHGLVLVDLEVHRSGGRSAVRFFIDKPGGVTLEDCQRFSEEVGDLLEVADLLPERCDLEVSSPGLERELRKERELRWAVGRAVRVWTREAVDGRREFAGRLLAVEEADLAVAEAAGPVRIPRAVVARVRLELPRAVSA